MKLKWNVNLFVVAILTGFLFSPHLQARALSQGDMDVMLFDKISIWDFSYPGFENLNAPLMNIAETSRCMTPEEAATVVGAVDLNSQKSRLSAKHDPYLPFSRQFLHFLLSAKGTDAQSLIRFLDASRGHSAGKWFSSVFDKIEFKTTSYLGGVLPGTSAVKNTLEQMRGAKTGEEFVSAFYSLTELPEIQSVLQTEAFSSLYPELVFRNDVCLDLFEIKAYLPFSTFDGKDGQTQPTRGALR